MSLVLKCPLCDSDFQVLPEHAGQIVACPSCSEQITVPTDLPGVKTATPEPTVEPSVLACPLCEGQFGVTPDMDGTEVACPHCDKHVAIDFGTGAKKEPKSNSAQGVSPPPISINKRTGKKKRKRKVIKIADPESEPTPAPAPAPPVAVAPTVTPQPPSAATKLVRPAPSAEEAEELVAQDSDLLPPKRKKSKETGKASKDKTAKPAKKNSEAKKPTTKKSKSSKGQSATKKNIDSTASKSTDEVGGPSKRGAPPEPPSKKVSPAAAATPPPAVAVTPPPAAVPPSAANIPDSKAADPEPDSVEEKETFRVTDTESKIPPKVSEFAEATETESSSTPLGSGETIESLLPPKFTAVDPDEPKLGRKPTEEHKIILPDGEGGYKRIDERVVHVERDGKRVQLYTGTKEERERSRMIQNVVALFLGVIILGLAFYILIFW